MILQKVQFKNDIQGTKELYYHINGEYTCDNEMVLMPGSKVETNTYFNSFSIGKWSKYTSINTVYLQICAKGNFKLKIFHSRLDENTIVSTLFKEINYEFNEPSIVELQLSKLQGQGNYYFTVEAIEKTIIYDACYKTDVNQENVKVAIVICTFRREEMVKKCIERLIHEVFLNENSRVRDYLKVFIIDNGKTLSSDMGHPFISTIPNKNYGGAGGFTRGIIEAIDGRENFTHVLLMDDDALVSSEVIERTYCLISLLKHEYKDYVIGGGLLRQDIPYIQYEAGARWNYGKVHVNNHNLDMREYKNVLMNELENNEVDYNGWWYCCIPTSTIHRIKLPLPIFIHRDDIEYGIRAKHQFIYMNGIGVWHEAFENKMQGVLDYYELRNLAITNAIHCKEYSVSEFKFYFIKNCLKNIFKNQYQYVYYNIKAVEDFCKGLDYLKKVDAEKLHSELLESNYKALPLNELANKYTCLKGYVYEVNLKKYEISSLKRRRKNILSTLVFNGMLLPLRRKAVILQSNMPMYCNFSAKTTIHTDSGNKAFVTRHSYRGIMKSLLGVRKACKLIDREFENRSKEFHERYEELINIDFWKKYLDI